MSKSELLGSAVTVLSFLITVGTLGAKLVSLLEKLKAGQSFLREELQEFRIDAEERTDRLEERLRAVEKQTAARGGAGNPGIPWILPAAPKRRGARELPRLRPAVRRPAIQNDNTE